MLLHFKQDNSPSPDMWHPAEAQAGILWIKELFPMATASQIAVVRLTPGEAPSHDAVRRREVS